MVRAYQKARRRVCRQKDAGYGSGGKKATWQTKEKVEGPHWRRPEGERIEWRGGWGQSPVEKTSEEQRPHMNMGAAAEEEEEEEEE